MLTVRFSGERLLVLEALPKGRKFNQDYFLQSVLPALKNENDGVTKRTQVQTFCPHGQRSTSEWSKSCRDNESPIRPLSPAFTVFPRR
jgi:hypothetical protein